MCGEARHENRLHQEAAVAVEAETGADRVAGEATVAAGRTVGLAGTNAGFEPGWTTASRRDAVVLYVRSAVVGTTSYAAAVPQELSSCRSLSSGKAVRNPTKDLWIPRQLLICVSSRRSQQSMAVWAAVAGRNAWGLRREPFAQRKARLPMDDSRALRKTAKSGCVNRV
jgi:hypothetical protein